MKSTATLPPGQAAMVRTAAGSASPMRPSLLKLSKRQTQRLAAAGHLAFVSAVDLGAGPSRCPGIGEREKGQRMTTGQPTAYPELASRRRSTAGRPTQRRGTAARDRSFIAALSPEEFDALVARTRNGSIQPSHIRQGR